MVLTSAYNEIICLTGHLGWGLPLFCGTHYKWILLNFNVLSLTGLVWGSFSCCVYIRYNLFLAIASAIILATEMQCLQLIYNVPIAVYYEQNLELHYL